MAEVLLFHHALGLTPGCHAFAEGLRRAGHVVHVPDLYDGQTFSDLNDGVEHAEKIGFDAIVEHGRRIADTLPNEIVYAGMSLGVMPAQALAQTRAGARGAVLLHGAVPVSEFSRWWPGTVRLQIHTMADDEWGDVDIARDLADGIPGAELYLYPGDRHLFTDNSVEDYEPEAAAQVLKRVLRFLSDL